MPEIIFPVGSAPGINPTESGGRLINAQVEYAPEGSRSKFVWRSVPGLRSAANVGSDTSRGALKFGTSLVTINDDLAYSVAKAGGTYTPTALTGDAVPGTGPVIMARNMRATPQIIVVTDNGMSLIEGGVVADFSDGDLPAPNSVCFKDGFFFFGIGDGRCFATAINDVTVASTDWTRAESSPDGLVRVYPTPNGIALGGENSTELFSNTAEPSGFPFSRSAVLPFGLFGTLAVTGFEEGFTGEPLFVANDGSVRLLSGYGAERVSAPDLERLINAITDRSTLEASCYVVGAQPVYVLSCDEWTWEFSPASKNAPPHWRERRSIGSNRWRGRFIANAFDEWLAFNRAGPEMYRIDPAYRWEADEQLVVRVRSTQAHRFPGRAAVHRASFDIRTGVGRDTGIDPIETTPKVAIAWSDDGGVTFSNPLLRPLGTQGEIVPIDVNRCGMTGRYGRQWELVIADPVDIAIYGGAMDIEERAA